MMKKLVSLILIAMLICTSLPFSCAAQGSDEVCSAEDAELLYALGVTETVNLTATTVTRAQFVRYAMKLAGIPISPYVGVGFADVPKTHVDYDYIMSAVDFGLISVAGNFRPEDAISANEACKILIMLLGYDFMAEANGGYPYGYLWAAQSIDLTDGVNTSSSAMTEYDVCTLLSNALSVRLPEVTYTEEGASEYHIGTATLLSKYRGIIEVSGVVDGVSHYSDVKSSGLGDNKISINGSVYYTGSLNFDSLFGYDVTAYYDTKSKKLISCTPSASNRILSIYAEDIEDFKGGTFTYFDNNQKLRSASVDINSTIFYNGRIFDYDALKMIPESGSLTFVSHGSSGVYETLYINSYKTIVVKRISQSDGYMIVDKFSGDNSLIIDPDDTELSITDQDGNELSFSSIITGDVVNAAVSDDGKRAELICVKDEFMGTYSGYSADYIEVDGSEYRLTNTLKSKISDIISVGQKAIFRLDIEQRIADVIPSEGVGEDIGYLVIGKLIENGMSSRLAVRILNLNGKIYDYDFADVFTVNGNAYKDFKTAYNTLKNPDYDSITCGVVKFALNSDGKLKSLVYADKYGGNGGFYVTNTIEQSTKYQKFSKWYYSIGRDIVCDTDLKVFKVPNPLYSVGGIDDEQFAVVEPGFITEETAEGYKMEGYTTVPDDGMSKYLLMQKIADDASSDSAVVGSSVYMVNKIRKALVDGDNREVMELCNSSNLPSSPLLGYSKNENDFSLGNIKPGDIIRIARNEENMVLKFEHIYKVGEASLADGTYEMSSSNTEVSQSYIAMAIPYRFRSSVLDVLSADLPADSASETDLRPRYMLQTKVLKYDKRLESIVEISTNEIKDYLSFGNNRDRIIYYMNYESLSAVFVIE